MLFQLRCQGFQRLYIHESISDAPEEFIQSLCIRADFPHFQAFSNLGKIRFQTRLRCRTQYSCAAIIGHQFAYTADTRPQIRLREHLRFIKDEDTIGNIMYLAAPAGLGRKEGFKKLHIRRHNDGRIPVFSRQLFAVQAIIFFFVIVNSIVIFIVIDIHMMFDDVTILQDIAENISSLFNNRRIRDDINNPLFLILYSMFQGKSQGRQGLTAASRNSQAKHTGILFSCIQTLPINFLPFLIDRCSGFPKCCIISKK